MRHLTKALAAVLLLSFASACTPSPEALSRYEPPPRVDVTFYVETFDVVTKERLPLPVTALVVTPGYEREVLHLDAPTELHYNSNDRRGVEDYTSLTVSIDAGPETSFLACWWVAKIDGTQYTSGDDVPGAEATQAGVKIPATCTFNGIGVMLREARQRELDVLDHDGGSSGN